MLAFFVVNVVAIIITKITPLSALKYITALLPFILFASIFNFILGYIGNALNLAARLILICNITQCYKKAVSATSLASAIELLFYPLRVFKIDSKDVSLMVCISIAFLPVLRRDFSAIRMSLRSKGMRLSFKNFKYFLKPFFIGILQRTNEISKAICVKAYGL